MANEPNEVRDAIIRRLRSEQEKEYQLVNNLLGEMNRYMLQKLDRAEEETKGAFATSRRAVQNLQCPNSAFELGIGYPYLKHLRGR
ncbi:hypothetical protein Tco_0041674 [Tanacetum coccineum]